MSVSEGPKPQKPLGPGEVDGRWSKSERGLTVNFDIDKLEQIR